MVVGGGGGGPPRGRFCATTSHISLLGDILCDVIAYLTWRGFAGKAKSYMDGAYMSLWPLPAEPRHVILCDVIAKLTWRGSAGKWPSILFHSN